MAISSTRPPPHSRADQDAHWGDAVGTTVALWLFTLLIYLPIIVGRHPGQGLLSIALDCSTILVSMEIALLLFALFRATLRWRTLPRVAALVLATTAAAIAQAMFDLAYTAWMTRHVLQLWASLPVDLRRGYGAALNYLGVFGVNLTLFQLSCARRRGRRQERRNAAMLASGQQAELEALRFRLNPHFLFNTLNAISSMIVTQRSEAADAMVERLAAFLRASFACDPLTPVLLEDEVAAVEQYARIEETRFSDRLAIVIALGPGTAGVPVPAQFLQQMMEPAVEAVAGRVGHATRISLDARRDGDALRLHLAIDPPLDRAIETPGIAHARARLAALYGEGSGEIGAGADGSISIRLPTAGFARPPAAG